jgi:hypothetical protein
MRQMITEHYQATVDSITAEAEDFRRRHGIAPRDSMEHEHVTAECGSPFDPLEFTEWYRETQRARLPSAPAEDTRPVEELLKLLPTSLPMSTIAEEKEEEVFAEECCST